MIPCGKCSEYIDLYVHYENGEIHISPYASKEAIKVIKAFYEEYADWMDASLDGNYRKEHPLILEKLED